MAPYWIYIPSTVPPAPTIEFSCQMALVAKTGQEVEFGAIQDESGDNPFTICMWIKMNESTGDVSLFGNYLDGYMVYLDDDGSTFKPGFSSYTTAGAGNLNVVSDDDIAANRHAWYHIAIGYNGDYDGNNMKMWINGSEVSGTTVVANTATTMLSDQNLMIGNVPGYDNPMQGTMGDVVKLSWMASDDDITEIYNSGETLDMTTFSKYGSMSSNASCMWVNWQSDNVANGGTITDLINGSEGTVASDSLWTKVLSSPGYTFGEYSCSFGGTDEEVICDDTSAGDEDGTDAFSISTWFKSGTTSAHIVNKVSSGDNFTGWNWLLSGTVAGMYFRDSGGGLMNAYTSGLPNTNDNTWHHLAFTYDGSKTLAGCKVYYDAKNYAIGSGTDTLSGSISNSTGMSLGCYNIGGKAFSTHIQGDFVKIPTELTELQVRELYNAGLSMDMTKYSDWDNIKDDARTVWLTWESDNVVAAAGITDLSDNLYEFSGQNMEVGDKVQDTPG